MGVFKVIQGEWHWVPGLSISAQASLLWGVSGWGGGSRRGAGRQSPRLWVVEDLPSLCLISDGPSAMSPRRITL